MASVERAQERRGHCVTILFEDQKGVRIFISRRKRIRDPRGVRENIGGRLVAGSAEGHDGVRSMLSQQLERRHSVLSDGVPKRAIHRRGRALLQLSGVDF